MMKPLPLQPGDGGFGRGALALALMVASSSAAAFVADGALQAGEGYSSGLEISFTVDGVGTVGGGFVAFGEDASGQYLYFAEPRGFVDNSYDDANHGDDPGSVLVGWNNKAHKFGNLSGSDKAGFTFYTNTSQGTGAGTLDVLVDYVTLNGGGDSHNPADYDSQGISGGDGKVNSASGGASGAQITDAATSIEYNMDQFGTNSQGLDVLKYSPTAAGSMAGGGDGTGSDPADYEIVGDAAYKAAFDGWIFDVGYELQFAPGTFDSHAWANPVVGADPKMVYGTTSAGNVIALFDMSTSGHASPSKLGQNNPDSITVTECPQPGEPGYPSSSPVCNLGGTPPPVGVPEPASLALLSVGLLGLGRFSRRRAASRS